LFANPSQRKLALYDLQLRKAPRLEFVIFFCSGDGYLFTPLDFDVVEKEAL